MKHFREVTCINSVPDHGPFMSIKEGRTYNVVGFTRRTDSNELLYKLEGMYGGFFPNRFKATDLISRYNIKIAIADYERNETK